MKSLAVNVLILLVLSSCQPQEQPRQEAAPQDEHEILLDLAAIAGKPPAEVEQFLGTLTSTEKITVGGKVYPRHSYRDGEVTIVFVRNNATWLKFYPTQELPFQKSSLAALGLPVAEPSILHPLSLMRWTNFRNLREVNFFGNPDGTIRYISVCVTHCP